MSSSARELHITDATLCALRLSGVDARSVRAYYRAMLDLGVAYVQISADALNIIGGAVDPARTVLAVPSGCTDIPASFGGYLSQRHSMPGMTICECALGDTPQPFANEIRWTAGRALFNRNYAHVLERLAGEQSSAFCPRGAGELAAALAVEWVLASGRRVTASLLGTGGYAPIEEVLAALHVYGMLPESIRLDRLHCVSEAYERMTGLSIPAHKSVIGSALFDVESGVHVDGIMKNRQCYEPFAPKTVGARRCIVIGKHTGKRALELKLEELGLQGAYDLDRLLERVREESIRTGGALQDGAFMELAKRVQGGDAA